MNPDPIQRLLSAAARAPQPPPGEMPGGMAARVLAVWRAGRSAAEDFDWIPMLRQGLATAMAIATVSLAYGYHATRHATLNELALADSMIQMPIAP